MSTAKFHVPDVEDDGRAPEIAREKIRTEGDLEKWSGRGWSQRRFQLQEGQRRLVFWRKNSPQEPFYVELAQMYDVRAGEGYGYRELYALDKLANWEVCA